MISKESSWWCKRKMIFCTIAAIKDEMQFASIYFMAIINKDFQRSLNNGGELFEFEKDELESHSNQKNFA